MHRAWYLISFGAFFPHNFDAFTIQRQVFTEWVRSEATSSRPACFAQSSANLLRNLVEPDLALLQSLPDVLRELSPEPCWTWPGSPPKPPRRSPGTFSGTLLKLSWLCNKVSRNLFRLCTKADLLRNLLPNPLEPDLALHQSLPTFSGTFSGTVEPDLALHQSLPAFSGSFSGFSGTFSGNLLNLTWLCTKASQPSPEPSPELLNLTWLCTKASQPSLEPSPELLNLTWLCTKASQPSPEPPEPSPEPCWTWPGSAPKPPRLSPEPLEPSPELLNLIRCLHQCTPELFCAEDLISLRYLGKHNVSCKSEHSNRIHDVAVPMQFANGYLQTTIRIARQYWRTYTILFSTLLFSSLP